MELLYYLWLSTIKGCGPVTTKKLIETFGSAEEVYRTDDIGAFIDIDYMNYETAFALVSDKNLIPAEEQFDFLQDRNIECLTLSDGDYPQVLRDIYDPPSILYWKGKNLFRENLLSVAIVGARKATPYGLSAAKTVSAELAQTGINVVSGLANGIDSAAHKGALSVNGSTIGVMGCGIDLVYPSNNKKLYESIVEHDGMVLTEFPPGTTPVPTNFPRRNRIISGLSYGTLVVEAAENSGSLITAKYAAEQGREVYAVPGNITNTQSTGCNLLIKDGAKLVTKGSDLLEDMFHVFRPMVEKTSTERPELTEGEQNILKAVQTGINTAGEIARHLSLPIGTVNGTVTLLELKGIVTVDMGIIYLTY
jgi:DNA processing protein